MRLRLARRLALGAYLGLFCLVLVWHAWLHPSMYFPTALVLLVTAAPLLLPLRGLLHGRVRAHLWASLLMLPYLVQGVVEGLANPPQRAPALAQLALSLVAFGAAAAYARWAAPGPHGGGATL
jgi:uncharacterized membrane protein